MSRTRVKMARTGTVIEPADSPSISTKSPLVEESDILKVLLMMMGIRQQIVHIWGSSTQQRQWMEVGE